MIGTHKAVYTHRIHIRQLAAAIKQFSAGETTEVTLYRANEELKLSITFDEAKPDSTADSPARTK